MSAHEAIGPIERLERICYENGRDNGIEQAIRILQAQLCGRSALDAVLNQCITEIRKLQGSSSTGSKHG